MDLLQDNSIVFNLDPSDWQAPQCHLIGQACVIWASEAEFSAYNLDATPNSGVEVGFGVKLTFQGLVFSESSGKELDLGMPKVQGKGCICVLVTPACAQQVEFLLGPAQDTHTPA